MIDPDDELLLNAYVDGELDAAGVIEMERRLRVEPELAATRDRLLGLREAIRIHAPRQTASDALKARILANVLEEGRSAPATTRIWRRRTPSASLLTSLAASLVIAAGLAGYFVAPRATPEGDMINALIAGHMRGQISGHPVDVASSDRHTVKPWLAAKLPVAAVVVDLAKEGFPLVGARLDIVDGGGAPTLVFKRREHLISVTELPAQHGATTPSSATRRGYPVVSWTDRNHSYVAISDLSPAELQTFARLFREAADKEWSATPGAQE
jgi:anti-sigma factor RsiW